LRPPDLVIEVVRTQQLRLLGAFTLRGIMDVNKLLNAIESAHSRILANISPETLEEIENAVAKKVAEKSAANRKRELRHSDGRA